MSNKVNAYEKCDKTETTSLNFRLHYWECPMWAWAGQL